MVAWCGLHGLMEDARDESAACVAGSEAGDRPCA